MFEVYTVSCLLQFPPSADFASARAPLNGGKRLHFSQIFQLSRTEQIELPSPPLRRRAGRFTVHDGGGPVFGRVCSAVPGRLLAEKRESAVLFFWSKGYGSPSSALPYATLRHAWLECFNQH